MANIEHVKTLDGEEAFLNEVLNKKPIFQSNEDAISFLTDKLKQLADFEKVSIEKLLSDADKAHSPTQLQELALSLSKDLNVLKRLNSNDK